MITWFEKEVDFIFLGILIIFDLFVNWVTFPINLQFIKWLCTRGNMVDAFRVHIMQTKELGTCPVRQIGGCSFFYMRISNVYIVIVVSSNANVACAFKFVVEVLSNSRLLYFLINLILLEFQTVFLCVVVFLSQWFSFLTCRVNLLESSHIVSLPVANLD